MDLGIRGKVALVTGGSRGIGREISLELGREGCKVVVVARRQNSIDETLALIKEQGGTAIGISADLTVFDNYDKVVAETTRTFGAPEIAIWSLESPGAGHFQNLTEADFAHAYHVTSLCYLRMVKVVLPGMRERKWGRIVTIGSGAAKQPVRSAFGFDYHLANATRSAALVLAKTIATDVAKDGITVNTVGVGLISTDNQKEWFTARARENGVTYDQFLSNFMQFIPAGRIGHVREMSAVTLFLCSDRASYITGEIVTADGGIFNTII
jgi:3-oxoacyl-[acyl-carrier protein] reductase